MQSAIDITWLQLALFSITLVIPLAISRYYQLQMNREILIATVRMAVQLTLVGLYLQFVFELNSVALNITWLVIMVLIGGSAIIDKANLPKKRLMIPVVSGLFIGLLPVILLLCFYVIEPSPWYSAQYLIPISGMLLGNSLSGNIVALQNLYDAFEQRKDEYHAALSLGASVKYASVPFVRTAMQKALAPILASMTTTGLVTLPGMMTGQILGGASPLLAIKYQLVIMIAIFVMMSISLTVSLQLSIKQTITKEGKVLIKFIKK
ncbi:ABC transporter permease [Vibrio sp. MACH09]|uniref:ABC transporter permease n=1 Tax=unclassified Vibrio TaxID=2614977 RepID=UPI0014933543|nr:MULTISPECIES: ABC transporter permease [unclassified Vibrio]NOI68037.1 ABC transporter permease [Vibrio sp. 99-8-1]GLO61198.1 ABC transporter permease [Vibrio sp. MACH09]